MSGYESPENQTPAQRDKDAKKASRRSKIARDPVVVAGNAIFTVLVVCGLLAFAAFHYGNRWLNAPGDVASDTTVMIPRGSGSNQIGAILQENGYIDNPRFFNIAVILEGARGKMKAGEYRIPANASVKNILDLLVAGKVVEHTLTFAEGLTSQQIVQRLLDEPVLIGSISQIPLEGSLLPETYKITRGDSREGVLARMEEAQQKLLEALWEKRPADLPVKNPRELVTLASIVEKETGVASERPHVASVFINRLKKGMRLQSDPTIIYGIVGGKGSLGRSLTRTDISTPTPYNTYTIPALPPGPIANPGRASLEAVIKPLPSNDYFFVADGTGGHVFAETYAEHQRNVVKWREIEKNRGAAAVEDAKENGADAASE